MTMPRTPYPDEIYKKALEWRIRIEGGDVSVDDRIEFEAWLVSDIRHQQAYDRAGTVWSSFETLDARKVGAHLFKPSVADSLRSAFIDLPGKMKTPQFQVGALVASAVTIFAGFLLISQIFSTSARTSIAEKPVITTYATKLGEFKTILLSDESELTLGPATEISVAMSVETRNIGLSQGAVVFDVAPDAARPFRVNAGAFTATALGTVFDVRNNGGVVRLSVSEGAVEAAHPLVLHDKLSSVISRRRVDASQQVKASAAEGLSNVTQARANSFAAWRDDRLRYVGAPLSELIADANRYSDVPIVIESGETQLNAIKVTFSFDGNDVDSMLRDLPNLFPVTVDRSLSGQITIRENTTD